MSVNHDYYILNTLEANAFSVSYKKFLPSDFTDEVSDELVVGRLLALALGRPGLQGIWGCLVTLIKAGTNLVPRCHCSTVKPI